ncbi:MAG TPA: SAF domain-containing protein [Streptomyces sp.]
MVGATKGRRLPYLLAGVLLVLGCAAGGVVVATSIGDSAPVLVLARPVAVGQVLSARDLREESLPSGSGLGFIPARFRSRAEGRPVAYSLPAGTPLTKNLLGAARVPAAGEAEAAVGLKAGQFPPGVRAGSRVSVVTVPGDASGSGDSVVWDATVTDVRDDNSGQTTVISLLMAESDARRLAAEPVGQISVVTVHGGGQ